VKRLLLMAMAALLLSIGTACAGPKEDGVAAYYRHDYATALRIFRPLAAQGNAAAQFSLGLMYANGQGVAQDNAEAVKWYQLAAKQKHTQSQLNLGTMYLEGKGVAQDYAEAVKWYRFAADRGNAEANFFLGTMYAEGQGVAKDLVRAYMWLSLGAVSGDADAKNRDILAKQMTPQQIAEAQKLARDCPQRGYSRCD
jgi:TPR repeat protein